ncbi:MAG: PH domain-containing protein [Actinomycetota bacterium]|nr:PH domain-containing protein [Actinomycetota bacterium]
MDNTDSSRSVPACRFGPDRRLTALSAALAVGSAVGAALGHDRGGQLLLGVAALILAAYAITDLAYCPRLTVSGAGLDICSPSVRGHFDWSVVATVRADSRVRAGLRSVTLEIDVADTLVVLSRRALGADPETVAGLVQAFAPR